MLAVIAGIPGAGKTTVVTKALEKVERKYQLVTYGTVMFEIASARGLVKDRDEMRKLPQDVQKDVQKKAAEKIHDMAKKADVILDTHCTIKTPRGFISGLPLRILEKLEPDLFVLVETDPKEIIMRREGDKSRVRDAETAEDLQVHQDINRMAAASYSVISGAAIGFIQNRQGRLEMAADELAAILK
jgi:adenylate kinase